LPSVKFTPKRFHRQFAPLNRQDLPALFLAIGV
jgi:hypothetical protein